MTFFADLRHYLDEQDEIVSDMPVEARQLASFLALIVDEASANGSVAQELTLRCRESDCPGTILAIANSSSEIRWQCPACGEDGVIRNWQGTKWDHRSDA